MWSSNSVAQNIEQSQDRLPRLLASQNIWTNSIINISEWALKNNGSLLQIAQLVSIHQTCKIYTYNHCTKRTACTVDNSSPSCSIISTIIKNNILLKDSYCTVLTHNQPHNPHQPYLAKTAPRNNRHYFSSHSIPSTRFEQSSRSNWWSWRLRRRLGGWVFVRSWFWVVVLPCCWDAADRYGTGW